MTLANGTQATVNLQMDPLIQQCLSQRSSTTGNQPDHQASVAEISAAAMRFYHVGGLRRWAKGDYEDQLFILRRSLGYLLEVTSTGSVGTCPPIRQRFHSEEVANLVELLGYGIAVNFVATFLSIPLDRFFFLQGGGARCDFAARITRREIMAAGASTNALAPSGKVFQLEVKTRTGVKSFGTVAGGDALDSIGQKAAALSPGRGMIAVFVGVHGIQSLSGRCRGRTDILVADPGEAEPIPEAEQLVVLLNEIVCMSHRTGLWLLMRDALLWLRDLPTRLTENEVEFLELCERRYRADQRQSLFLPTRRTVRGRSYVGRDFNELLFLLSEPPHERQASSEAIRQRLAVGDLGEFWFMGIDQELIGLVEARDGPGLIGFGTLEPSRADASLAGRSAFLSEPHEPSQAELDYVRDEVEGHLENW